MREALLIHHVTAVPMDGSRTALPDAYVIVEGAVIREIGTGLPAGFTGKRIDGGGGILMPGLVDAHTHLPMTLMRGYGDGHDLQEWLTRYIFPVEDRWDARSIRAATRLALCELISGGVTTVADMYYFCEEIAQEVAACGLNANLSRGISVFDAAGYEFGTHPSCRQARALAEKWHGYGGGQIRVDMSVHAEYTSFACPQLWKDLSGYARENGLGMQVHVSETKKEQQECLARWGRTPAALLNEYGLWDVRAVAAHGVWLTPEDRALMAEKGVSVAHNPVSNLKLGSGIAPVPEWMEEGINVCLGTDGVSSNNSHDMFEEMKTAVLLQNGTRCDPLALSAWDALEMATVNGARALGRDTGRIAAGCDADLVLLDAGAPNLIPCHDPVSNIVYSARGSNVVMTRARGKILYEHGRFLTLDPDGIRKEISEYALPHLFGAGPEEPR